MQAAKSHSEPKRGKQEKILAALQELAPPPGGGQWVWGEHLPGKKARPYFVTHKRDFKYIKNDLAQIEHALEKEAGLDLQYKETDHALGRFANHIKPGSDFARLLARGKAKKAPEILPPSTDCLSAEALVAGLGPVSGIDWKADPLGRGTIVCARTEANDRTLQQLANKTGVVFEAHEDGAEYHLFPEDAQALLMACTVKASQGFKEATKPATTIVPQPDQQKKKGNKITTIQNLLF